MTWSNFLDFFVLEFFRLLIRTHLTKLCFEILYLNFDLFLSQFQLVFLGPKHHNWLILTTLFVSFTPFFIFWLVFKFLFGLWISTSLSFYFSFGLFVESDTVEVDESMGIGLLGLFVVIAVWFEGFLLLKSFFIVFCGWCLLFVLFVDRFGLFNCLLWGLVFLLEFLLDIFRVPLELFLTLIIVLVWIVLFLVNFLIWIILTILLILFLFIFILFYLFSIFPVDLLHILIIFVLFSFARQLALLIPFGSFILFDLNKLITVYFQLLFALITILAIIFVFLLLFPDEFSNFLKILISEDPVHLSWHVPILTQKLCPLNSRINHMLHDIDRLTVHMMASELFGQQVRVHFPDQVYHWLSCCWYIPVLVLIICAQVKHRLLCNQGRTFWIYFPDRVQANRHGKLWTFVIYECLDDVLYDWLDLVLGHQFVNTLGEIGQDFGSLLLAWVHILLKSTVKWKHNQFMSPNNSRYQRHVQKFVTEFYVLLVHKVEQLLGELLRIVDEIDWHEICFSCNYLFFS